MSNRKIDRLSHLKSDRGIVEKGFPSKEQGKDGNFEIRYIPGYGLALFAFYAGNWYVSRMELQKINKTDKKLSVDKLEVKEFLDLKKNPIKNLDPDKIDGAKKWNDTHTNMISGEFDPKFRRTITNTVQLGGNNLTLLNDSGVLSVVDEDGTDAIISAKSLQVSALSSEVGGGIGYHSSSKGYNLNGTLLTLQSAHTISPRSNFTVKCNPTGSENVAVTETTGTITAFSNYNDTVANTTLCADASHGLTTNDLIKITSADSYYNGEYIVTVINSDSFRISKIFKSDTIGTWTNITTGIAVGQPILSDDTARSGQIVYVGAITVNGDDEVTAFKMYRNGAVVNAASDGGNLQWTFYTSDVAGLVVGSQYDDSFTKYQITSLNQWLTGVSMKDGTVDASGVFNNDAPYIIKKSTAMLGGAPFRLDATGQLTLTSTTADQYGLIIDKDIDNDTAATQNPALHIDYDRVGAVTSGTDINTGIAVDMNVTGAGTSGTPTVNTIGLDINVVGDNAGSGTSTNTGLHVTATGADSSRCLTLKTGDSSGRHMRFEYDDDNYGTIFVNEQGMLNVSATTTVDSVIGGGNITFDGGNINFKAAGELDAVVAGGNVNFLNGGSKFLQLHMDGANSYFQLWAGGSYVYAQEWFKITVLDDGVTKLFTNHGASGTGADLEIEAQGDITLDSATGVFKLEEDGTEFSAANSAYAGMIIGMTIDGVGNVADSSYPLTTSYVVPDADEFKIQFTTPPSELVEITCTINAYAGSSGQDVLMSLSNHATYGSNTLTIPTQFENSLWNPPGRGTNNQATARWIVQANNLEAIGSVNTLYIAAKTDDTTGTTPPYLYWGGNATDEYAPLIIKAIALPLEASISINP